MPPMRRGYLMRSMRRDSSVKDAHVPKGTVKRIMTFVKPYHAELIVFLVLIVVDAVVGIANPLLLREIINKGIQGTAAADVRTRLIVTLALVVAVLAVFDGLLALAERFIAGRVGQGLVYDMRTKVFSHVQRMPVAFFTRTQTGALVSRLNNDVQGAQESFTDVLSNVIGNLIGVSLVLVLMFYLSWQITLAALVLLPAFLIPARWMGRKMEEITRESYGLSAEMNTTMVERFNVAGALLVKLFGRPEKDDAEFTTKAARVRDIEITRGMYARVFFVAMMLTASLATALVYGWGGVMTVNHLLDIGTVVAFTMLLARLYGPITALSNVNVDVMTALVSFDRVFEVLDLPLHIEEKPDAVEIPRGPARVELDHVAFTYPTADEVSLASLESIATVERNQRVEVLHEVSFTIEPGTLTALVGPSGAGKTTISQLVPRLYDVGGGAVRIDGIDVRDATFASLHSVVGVVTQDAHMFHDTLRANLLYAKPEASDEEMREAMRAAQILPLLDSLPDGLDTIVGDRGYRLSGGEKQRVAIARLLLKAPDVVVLDEATAHLDSESEHAVQVALKTALTGRTSLVIAHRLSTIRDADEIVVIDAGRVIERGRHAQLVRAGGLYAELYRTQFASQAGPGEVEVA